ncbi:MAG: Crp/Fnr family transcriptional regulator [Terriglobales bacterium]
MPSEFMRARVSQELEQALREMMTSRAFLKGAALFQQGTPAAGIYLVEKGSVRVLLATAADQTQLLDLVGPGSLLALSDNVAGGRYRVTVEAAEPTIAAFVERQAFMNFLGCHHEFCMQVVRLLSDNLHALYHKFRSVSAHPGRPRRRSLNEQVS